VRTVHCLRYVEIGDYSYISDNSVISYTVIGKFCSIGPNFLCGWGSHPTHGISTSPAFYSATHQPSFTKVTKVDEHAHITIGNDVFIGANVTVLEGVTIGDGAVIGAGAVVSKDIPPYAIAVGSPIKVIRYRFQEQQIAALNRIQWWNFPEEQLKEVGKMFFDIDGFISMYDKK
jgi:acetyltransferase-like isoleucine patch superfamily enzyme